MGAVMKTYKFRVTNYITNEVFVVSKKAINRLQAYYLVCQIYDRYCAIDSGNFI